MNYGGCTIERAPIRCEQPCILPVTGKKKINDGRGGMVSQTISWKPVRNTTYTLYGQLHTFEQKLVAIMNSQISSEAFFFPPSSFLSVVFSPMGFHVRLALQLCGFTTRPADFFGEGEGEGASSTRPSLSGTDSLCERRKHHNWISTLATLSETLCPSSALP